MTNTPGATTLRETGPGPSTMPRRERARASASRTAALLLLLLHLGPLERQAVAQAPGERSLPPPGLVQVEAEKRIKELFKGEYTSRSVAERRAFAAKLLGAAAGTDEAAMAYVLLREARDIAAGSGEASAAVAAIDAMAERFAVDADAMKIEALSVAAKNAPEIEDLEEVVVELLRLADSLLGGRDVAAAESALALARGAARKTRSVWLAFGVESREKELDELRFWESELESARSALAGAPEDPAIHQRLGETLCLGLGDWEAGLPHLAKAGAAVSEIAAKESARPELAGEQLELAAAWMAMGEAEGPPRVRALRRDRAFQWWETALRGLTGLERAEVELRLRDKPRRYLSDLQEFDVKVHGEFGKHGKCGSSHFAPDISVSSLGSHYGLSMHAIRRGDARVRYRLDGLYKKLEAFAAFNDTAKRPRSASTFIVEGDGRTLWKSRPIRERRAPQRCVVDIQGVDVLTLLVQCPGHHHDAHAVWLDPVVTK